ncbi:bifunctional pyr operon transcriptional regulator/uracil phosphoribosyltransferase PyrR [Nitrosococcus oceani]|uniref:Bifunctional protein PyrR n=2 Tax=Nitrosococcus oceani TaxID=1229 RepID=PYRR_NITOC|nr:bifunctional pyr operon transcriptional regulator/uracil phosphoribosyltransferase PyrR [Nitrosococcus oceani]Q3JE54.1 RecName: Full=Bifunctional protein PyrR; Includes: RecName: Full=Pyrimidine operon regulatory protein; Includes: RecName: Full=Uracil phosphoribosyltransferase; Short=UPRTase [Nitrosococcus oceani ATCC 19707]KFI20675.1 Uracil phosphoribosyltransferase [Nitrosococcus oceani C-27]ABA56892.1 Uracil phosphoribosyltransferase [Nitrosococcus oceani ATCC 19707]EDZ65440.1 hypothetic
MNIPQPVSLNIDALFRNLATGLNQRMAEQERNKPAMIGIHTGGVWVAERLLNQLDNLVSDPLGVLNIAYYRDDFTRIGMHPQVQPSQLPFSVADRHIILVDDVLYTGRTVRAALNEIFDYGRPASVTLAALVERAGRELPIQADVVGHHLDLAPNEQVKLTGPDPLQFSIQYIDPTE